LVISQEDVDKMTEPYLDLAEAHNLRAQVRKFVELNLTKNSKVVEFSQLVFTADGIRDQVDQLRTELNRLEAANARADTPFNGRFS
jgi:hypothetical protein